MKMHFGIKKFGAILSQDLACNELKQYNIQANCSIDPMLRRRLSKNARMLFALLEDFDRTYPMIFSSRYGEINRCFELLTQVSKNEFISPTSFSLSVHNAMLSSYGIYKQNNEEILATSSLNPLCYGLMQGYLKLQEGNDEVLLIAHYEGAKSEFVHDDLEFIIAMVIDRSTEWKLECISGDFTPSLKHDSIEFLLNFHRQISSWDIHDQGFCWRYTHEKIK